MSGLPPDAALWRHKELPPVETLISELNRVTYQLGMAQPGDRIQPPARLEPPGAATNVVSITEFAKRNRSNVRVA